jgi:hypothetical protein
MTPPTMAVAAAAIEIRVDKVAQLFHSLDPYPFRERDIDREAEEFIVGWAREMPRSQPIAIVVHLPESEARTKAASDLSEALGRHFAERGRDLQRDLNELFRVGRRYLAVGVPILVGCLLAARMAADYLPDHPLKRLVEESFLILGWVANWRPLEIFLYDWLPIVRRRNLFRRLSAASVDIRPYAA